jgi:putative copper export protein/methionine-rich copper-binding protein CopC
VGRRVGTVLTALTIALMLAGASPAAAEPVVRATYPLANAVLAQSPSQIALEAPSTAAARAGSTVVYDAEHRPIARVAAARRGSKLVSDLPKLGRGVYTVVWRLAAARGVHETGSFAFAVDAASPALVRQARPESKLNPASRVIPRWLAFAAIMTFIGALALRLFVTAPATRPAGEREEPSAALAAVDRRLLLLAAAAILLFIPARLAELVNEATDKDAGLGFWQSIRPGAISDYLTSGPDGTLYEIRLLLTAVAALVVVPVAAGALRRTWQHRPTLVGRVMLAGLVLGTAELVVRVIPTQAPRAGMGWPREIFTRAVDWGHMYSAAIWIGGLAGLALLRPSMRPRAGRPGELWPIVLRRFSAIATVCVGTLILTGLWMAWLHVGPPRLLVQTLYGETLLVKLILVLIVLAVAAANQLWLLPRIEAVRGDGGGSTASIALRRFRKTVVAEVVLGMLILLVVPFLSGSARTQELQAKAADLTQARQAGGHVVRLRPSGAQPGVTDYDVWAPDAGDRVSIAFSSTQLGVPETKVLATSLGGDRYRVSGLYTAIAGAWQARVETRRATATFDLGVTTTPAEPEKAPPPTVAGSTWAWGIGELLAVLLVLGGSRYVARRLTRRRAAVGTLATPEGATT